MKKILSALAWLLFLLPATLRLLNFVFQNACVGVGMVITMLSTAFLQGTAIACAFGVGLSFYEKWLGSNSSQHVMLIPIVLVAMFAMAAYVKGELYDKDHPDDPKQVRVSNTFAWTVLLFVPVSEVAAWILETPSFVLHIEREKPHARWGTA